ncbi:MAG: ATP-grasp domain-containing protein [Bacilli bacterium]|nr:ATP-grasp domain-containing protein [Bacilli bacterium]
MNFIFISPNFPEGYYAFLEGLKSAGFNVLGIGDAPYDDLHPIAKASMTEYYRCYDMNNFDRQCEAVEFFENKYGHIDYLESNNEYWLRNDAALRQRFNIDGLRPEDMDNITNKAEMKKFFLAGGAKVARYHMVDDKARCLAFIKEVNYPVFIKPAVGVGAQRTYKISNENDLDRFFMERDVNVSYIMEEFITGDLMSFDGICNSKGEVVICDESHFLTPIDVVLHEQIDNRYYTTAFVDPKFEKIGRAVVKAFGIKKRFFHIEFFRLTATKKGLGKKGDYVGLECNMRPPGGSTPDMINFALSTSCHHVWADVMMFDENRERTDYEKFICMAATRRDRFNYVHSFDEVCAAYYNNICMSGRNPEILSDALGNDFFYGKFKTLKEAMAFADFALLKKE